MLSELMGLFAELLSKWFLAGLIAWPSLAYVSLTGGLAGLDKTLPQPTNLNDGPRRRTTTTNDDDHDGLRLVEEWTAIFYQRTAKKLYT